METKSRTVESASETVYEVQSRHDGFGWQCIPEGKRSTLQEAIERRARVLVRHPQLRIVEIVITRTVLVPASAECDGADEPTARRTLVEALSAHRNGGEATDLCVRLSEEGE